MEKFFSISETAKIVGTTSETLRHYDRIDLVKPHKIDKWTGYRYYSEDEIVRLNLVKTLRCMDLPLDEIKKILKSDDFKEIVEFLEKAEQSANEKIEELIQAKTKIRRAKLFYESKQTSVTSEKEAYTRIFPQRVILLSQTLTTPTVGNLWNYLRHFYAQIGEAKREEFAFEDLAGIYQTEGDSRLFAVCTRYSQTEGLKILPAGKYLCADCTEETRKEVSEKLLRRAKNEYGTAPEFSLCLVVLSGMLQWNYQIQVFIEPYTVNTLETEEIGCTVRLPQFVYAPIKKGEVLGTAVYTLNGDIIGTADICAPKSIAVINAAPNKGAVFLRNLKYILLNI